MRVGKWTVAALVVVILIGGCVNMPHGYPPWSGISKQTVFSIPIDLAELAVRLGSPVTFDRRGDVVYIDSFEHGHHKWIASFGGTGGGVQVSHDTARTGAYSIKLITGKAAGGHGSLDGYHPRPVLSKVGLEASFAPISADPTTYLSLFHYTGEGCYRFQVRYDYANEKLQYLDDAATWQDLATGLAFYPNRTSFNLLKVVADLEDNEYERVLFNDVTYPLQDVAAFYVAGASAPYLLVGVSAKGDASDNYTVYVDDVIITQNEP